MVEIGRRYLDPKFSEKDARLLVSGLKGIDVINCVSQALQESMGVDEETTAENSDNTK